MVDDRTNRNLNTFTVLEDKQYYIYVMRNTAGKIKIGITTNIEQRYKSLSNSNAGGESIANVWCSPTTYLYSLESNMHNRFDKYRIKGTEWFYYKNDPSGDYLYTRAINTLQSIFSSNEYEVCNNERKKYNEKKENK